ncbi:MAG: hypothetical protein MZU97_08850 [Bacillus subtilis]|nr:hypothetical protein [Bacillus subtilis]
MSEQIQGEYQRFNLIERLQHGILFVTFLLLAFSGWALKYPEMEQSRWWIGIWGDRRTPTPSTLCRASSWSAILRGMCCTWPTGS